MVIELAAIYEYSRIRLGIIWLSFSFCVCLFLNSCIWFYSGSVGYPASGSGPFRQFQTPSGMASSLISHWLATPTSSMSPLTQHILQAGQIIYEGFVSGLMS